MALAVAAALLVGAGQGPDRDGLRRPQRARQGPHRQRPARPPAPGSPRWAGRSRWSRIGWAAWAIGAAPPVGRRLELGAAAVATVLDRGRPARVGGHLPGRARRPPTSSARSRLRRLGGRSSSRRPPGARSSRRPSRGSSAPGGAVARRRGRARAGRGRGRPARRLGRRQGARGGDRGPVGARPGRSHRRVRVRPPRRLLVTRRWPELVAGLATLAASYVDRHRRRRGGVRADGLAHGGARRASRSSRRGGGRTGRSRPGRLEPPAGTHGRPAAPTGRCPRRPRARGPPGCRGRALRADPVSGPRSRGRAGPRAVPDRTRSPASFTVTTEIDGDLAVVAVLDRLDGRGRGQRVARPDLLLESDPVGEQPPVADPVGEQAAGEAHGEHPVGEDGREAGHLGHVDLVAVQRVVVARGARVLDDLGPGQLRRATTSLRLSPTFRLDADSAIWSLLSSSARARSCGRRRRGR